MKKKEILFIGILLLIAVLSLAFLKLRPQKPAAKIHIMQDGQDMGTYSLSEDQVIPIGDTNVCEIKDGTARMIEADCPDQLCIHQEPLSESYNGLIVCLPNQVIIEGVDIDADFVGVDAVS